MLASGSRYRAALLAEAGLEAEVDPPGIDERALDDGFLALGPEAFALDLARRKAEAVAPRHPGAVVIAGDQVGVLDTAAGPVMLTKQPTLDGAVEQLLSMSATTHRLVNGLVVLDTTRGTSAAGVDVQEVTFRTLTRAEVADYVGRFEPFDTAGSYRLEDQDALGPGRGFVVSVVGEDPSGVVGLPLPLLRRLLDQLGA